MSPPVYAQGELEDVHRLEMVVLTQVRDSLALINAGLGKLDAKVETLSNSVVQVTAARYDEQIAEMKRNFEAYRNHMENKLEAIDIRQRDHDRQVARLGLGMAISGALALASFTAMISKFLGVGG